jgi:peptidoglycan/LPS O-acetylase OafA/YrhL
MNHSYFVYGPDTSLGLIPKPEVLAYYAIFYGFGAQLFNLDDHALSKHWKPLMSVSLCILFPLGLITEWHSIHHFGHIKVLSDILQVSYTWLMVLACIGIFREKSRNPSPKMRYLSDASYWLYLAHLPLVFSLQLLIQDWPLSCWIKFPLVALTSFSILLLSYRYCIRGQWVGRFLNGK